MKPIFFAAPTLINPAYRLPLNNDSAPTPTTAVVTNLCTNIGMIVDQTTGPIMSVAYFVRQQGSTRKNLQIYYVTIDDRLMLRSSSNDAVLQ